MENHFYLKLKNKERVLFLTERTDDDLILLLKDLEQINTTCKILLEELSRRKLPLVAPETHLLPPEFFERDSRPRRLPNKQEYAWKRGLFLACKFSVVGILCGGFLIGTQMEALALPVILTSSSGMFAPLLFSWFNPFYRPLSYTLVRPFNTDEFSKPLKRFILKNIGLRCHGFTLSDRNFSPNRLLGIYHRLRWVFGILGVLLAGALAGPAMMVAVASTWIQQSVRLVTIYAPSGFMHLPQLFRRRRVLSGKHFFCGGQCFNIRTIDAAWKYAMQSLVYEADFIIVDLSFVRAGSHWEIELLEIRDRFRHCIPICQIGCDDAITRYSEQFTKIIYYDDSGRIVKGDTLVNRIRALPSYEPEHHVPNKVSQIQKTD